MARGPITFTLYGTQMIKKVRKREVNGAIPVVARSKARVCGRSLAGVASSNPA